MPIRNGSRRIKKLQALSADDRVDLWALDEVHFQQHGSRCRMWVPPEKFQFPRAMDKFDGANFLEFPEVLYPAGLTSRRRVIVITDNSKYHHAAAGRTCAEF